MHRLVFGSFSWNYFYLVFPRFFPLAVFLGAFLVYRIERSLDPLPPFVSSCLFLFLAYRVAPQLLVSHRDAGEVFFPYSIFPPSSLLLVLPESGPRLQAVRSFAGCLGPPPDSAEIFL